MWVTLERMKKSQSGNVLFYILLAVSLLAALAYAVAQGGRSSLSGMSGERARLFATEIIEYGNVMSNAVAQIRLRDYSDTQVSFENDIVSGYTNSNCSSDECKVFALDGGGVHYMRPDDEWLDAAQSASLRYGEIYIHSQSHVVDVGSENDDLILFIPYLKKEVCMAVNKLLGIAPANMDVPREVYGPFALNIKFTGGYVQITDRKISGDATTGEPEILFGKQAGCTQASGGASVATAGTYHFYKVLIAR